MSFLLTCSDCGAIEWPSNKNTATPSSFLLLVKCGCFHLGRLTSATNLDLVQVVRWRFLKRMVTREAASKVAKLHRLAENGKLTPESKAFSRLPFPEAVEWWLEEKKTRAAPKTYTEAGESARPGSRHKPRHKTRLVTRKCLEIWWTWPGSNRRPPACKAGALPAELHARFNQPSLNHFCRWRILCAAQYKPHF